MSLLLNQSWWANAVCLSRICGIFIAIGATVWLTNVSDVTLKDMDKSGP